MQRHLLAIAVILTVAPGCDNVEWGGVEMALVPPPTAPQDSVPEEAEVEDATPPRMPGSVLLAGVRDGSRSTLTVVAEVRGDSLAPFPDPRYPEDLDRLARLTEVGSEWMLFAEGVRVGRLVVDERGTSSDLCTPRTSVSGVVELVPEAAGAGRFMALHSADARTRVYREYTALQRDYDQGVASLNIVADVIPRVGAPWPEGGTLAARQDIQAIQLDGVDGQAVAATFVHRDQLAVAPPRQGAYAVFVLGMPTTGGYREAFSWYRSVDVDGKGVPRYFGHLDWDGDGTGEILLEVLGANRRWYAALDRAGSDWVRTYQDACGSGPSSG
jgi:hypothetical protein